MGRVPKEKPAPVSPANIELVLRLPHLTHEQAQELSERLAPLAVEYGGSLQAVMPPSTPLPPYEPEPS